jgi:hypothetical protein
MSSSEVLRRVALVATEVSKEHIASIITVTRIGELGTTLTVTNNRNTLLIFLRSVRLLLVTANVVPSSPILVTLMMEAIRSSHYHLGLHGLFRDSFTFYYPKYWGHAVA